MRTKLIRALRNSLDCCTSPAFFCRSCGRRPLSSNMRHSLVATLATRSPNHTPHLCGLHKVWERKSPSKPLHHTSEIDRPPQAFPQSPYMDLHRGSHSCPYINVNNKSNTCVGWPSFSIFRISCTTSHDIDICNMLDYITQCVHVVKDVAEPGNRRFNARWS
jgi:hypothetical protein